MERLRSVRRACAATVATAAAVALTAGMTGPSSVAAARDTGAAPGGAAQKTTQKTPQGEPRSGARDGTVRQRVTLITGDRVALDAKGRVVGVDRAEGRERIPVQTRRTAGGHTLVLPFDAQRLVAAGQVDQRLFDVTELSRKANRVAQKKGLKVIVGYRGADAERARARVRAAGDTTVRHTLKTLNADAVMTSRQDAADLWKAVTSENGDGATGAASGIAHLWLDGTRKASLDKSVPQIGAPKAWQAGYDGKGVRIAVLDTGVDATHPDLKDQVVAEKNFSTSTDAKDHFGHGTHVASISAGTGAKSGGRFKGVAPGAKLLSGKVLNDGGYGDDSGIIAGMDWAASRQADVVNLSLGGTDTPGIDPLEAAVNKLSADQGILFAVAAGNDGAPGSVGSPGSADAALTVGAVDDNDKLAPFSSQGPRLGDGAVKPDVTAPGVDITAAAAPGSVIDREVGQNPEGYLTISGTSMATPHVAGAAALLKQQHPNWKYAELKGALTASAKGGPYSAFEQGSGRIAVDRAIKQSVFAEPVSVSLGTQAWPHTDDKPVTKKATYRNVGAKDVTLDLTATATDPRGKPAPPGFFTLGAKRITVPAGGTASVEVTADSKLGGTVDGGYTAYIVASGGGQSVRTAAAVDREVESYDVTLKFIGRDGRPAPYYAAFLRGMSGLGEGREFFPSDASGTVKVRLPKGGYLFDTIVIGDPADETKGADWLVQPKLGVTKDATVTVDARKAEPVDVTVPDTAAKPSSAEATYSYFANENSGLISTVGLRSFDYFGTAHLGPPVDEGLAQAFGGAWTKGTDSEYDVAVGGPVKEFATGYTRHLKAAEFATVKVGLGASVPGKTGGLWASGEVGKGAGVMTVTEQKLPGPRTLHVSTPDKATWGLDFEQYGGQGPDGLPLIEAAYTLGDPQTFEPGRTYEKTFNVGVFGPRLGPDMGVFREGDLLAGSLPVFADGKGHSGGSLYASVKTSLYRNGAKIGENADPLTGRAAFKVPAADAEYKLSTSIKRTAQVAAASTRIDASWTFRSKKTQHAQLPVSTVRFTPALDLASRAPAGATQKVPVTIQGAAAQAGSLKSLAVYVSYDAGQTWQKHTVAGGKVSVRNPAQGKGISFRAKVTDKKGNRSTVSIYDAYYGK
ncbi:S8 family serine peptidase [Streptomyces sp. NPDC059009]|uniref:S8 family peptidase n=1 Tax=Streptomyces sp. NPDC059009 TaxID=3346694 RepID=UPI0036A55F69